MASGDSKQSISGTIIQEIIPSTQQEALESLLISNTHASASITVSLFAVVSGGVRFTIVKALVIPFGVSVVLKEEVQMIKSGVSLQIQLAGSTPIADIFFTNS